MNEILFYLVGIGCVMTAALAVTSKEIIHAIVSLAGLFVGIGLVYLQLGVPFLAAIQVLVYVGGVIVMMLFAIMLISKAESAEEVKGPQKKMYMGFIVTLLILMLNFSVTMGAGKGELTGFDTIQISNSLFGEYLLPFEILGLLLTAAAVGTIVLAMKENPEVAE